MLGLLHDISVQVRWKKLFTDDRVGCLRDLLTLASYLLHATVYSVIIESSLLEDSALETRVLETAGDSKLVPMDSVKADAKL